MVEAIRETNTFERDKALRDRVYEIKANLEAEAEDILKEPIHFDKEFWHDGAFVILNLQPDVLGKPSSIVDGGRAWNVSDRTKQFLRELEVPFNEGLPTAK